MINLIGQLPKSNWLLRHMYFIQGITVHYAAGRDVSPLYNTRDEFINVLAGYARWHISHIGNPTIAYHYAIDKWGTQYRLQDERVSWHTGTSWGNNYTLGILIPLGTNEEPTEQQVSSFFRLADYLTTRHNIKLKNVKGHKELKYTACPGRMMPYVIDFRSQTFFKPGFYRVIENASATVRSEPRRNKPSEESNIVLTLPSGHKEWIDAKVEGELIAQSNVWLHTGSGAGYIHSSALESVE